MRRYSRPPFFLFLLLLVLPAVAPGFTPGHAAGAADGIENSETASARYRKAKDYYYLLLRDKKVQNKRSNWQKGIRDFRRIYLDNPKGELAPKSLFMMAKMYYRMYMKFRVREDLDESIAYYNNVWTILTHS